MSVGERIKLARKLAGMSLRELSSKVGVTYQAISKYERGQSMSRSDVLIRLAEALNVKVEFFFRPTTIELNQLSFRKRTKLPRKEEDAILGKLQEWIERYV